MLGRSIGVDYDRLKQALGPTFSSYKPIPQGSKVEITIPPGTPAEAEFNATVEPDEGYEFDISYFHLDTPTEVEANIIVETSEGEFPLLAHNVTTETFIDASDFGGLSGIKKFTLYAKTVSALTADKTVSLEYGGKQVR
ncbi:hypothetical protein [Thermococcus sp.]|uniref:hypothetical protein n=1 Tax=Thermococcus sp. TaxID=35749 RepID=UPI0026299242|nr:hypothetical protein [Thermococcus sp.]